MLRKFLTHLFFLPLGLAITNPGLAQSKLLVNDAPLSFGDQDLSSYPVLVDTTMQLSLEEVINTQNWPKGAAADYSRRFANYWIAIPLENPTDESFQARLEIHEYATIARLYVPNENGYKEYITGRFVPMKERQIQQGRDFSFACTVPPNSAITAYLKFEAQPGSHMQYGNSVWLGIGDYDNWVQEQPAENLRQGIFHGLAWMMLIYILLQFLLFRDRAFLYYVFYVAAVSIFLLHNAGYLWQTGLGAYPKLIYQVELFIFIGLAMYFQFIRSFIKNFERLQWLGKVLKYYMWFATAFVALDFILSAVNSNLLRSIEHIFSASVVVMMLFSVIILIRHTRSHPMVWYLIFAFFSVIFGGTLVLLGVFELIPFNEYHFQVGVLLDFFLFSLGLNHRHRMQQQQEMDTQRNLIHQLQDKTDQIEKINSELEDKVLARTSQIEQQREEILAQNETLTSLNQNLEDTLKIVQRQNLEIATRNQQMIASLTYAEGIQRALLPMRQRLSQVFEEFFILYLPRDIVSGDFYYFQQVNGKTIMAAIDCTGHGVPGALMSMIAHALLDQIVLEKQETTPSEVLHELHVGIRKILAQRSTETMTRDGMDIALVVLNEAHTELTYAGAKLPLVYLQDGELQRIKGDRISIGDEALDERDYQYTDHTVALGTTTTIYLHSDGYQDQFGGPEGKKYLSKNFRELLESKYQSPMRTQEQELEETFRAWQGDHEQVDDVMVIGLRVVPKP